MRIESILEKVNGKEEGHRLILGVESKDGTLLTENEEVKNRWKEYFRELFNGEEREIRRVKKKCPMISQKMKSGDQYGS